MQSLDLTGNSMGDAVARMLSKALQINSRLTNLYLDRNELTAQGFQVYLVMFLRIAIYIMLVIDPPILYVHYCACLQDIAMALEKNFTLKVMPVSVIDAANAIKLQVSICT